MADAPRFALVVWRDRCEVCCLELEQAEIEAARGRVFIIGREDAECMPYHDEIEPSQSNPRRNDDPDCA